MVAKFDPQTIFYELLQAEREEHVEDILKNHGLLVEDEALWRPYGDLRNNIPTIGSQQNMAMPAFVEKIINSVDAMLMLECQKKGIPLEGDTKTPETMPEAVAAFFGISQGRLENITAKGRTELAHNIQVVATGSKSRPSYLVIDKGEGQCPGQFPNTLVSISKENKISIPFVQGKYNCGGTGVLFFCGEKNYQLVASRRHPELPGDATKDLWGFTLVRKLPPNKHRRSSTFVYLAPDNQVPTFDAVSINVLPGRGKPGSPPPAYAEPLEWGTCIKLYDYKMPRKGTATLELRYQLEKHLYTLCLPVRVTETRAYKANYYSTTVCGSSINIADHETRGRLEAGFPDSGSISLDGAGELPLVVSVYKSKDEKDDPIDTRDIPSGAMFTLNGQVHGNIEDARLGTKIDRTYIDKHLVVAVDFTDMVDEAREKFFMTSRDRIRQGDLYKNFEKELVTYLKEHKALKDLNSRRRLEQVKETLTDEESTNILGDLISRDPALADLLATGTRLKRPFGPEKAKKVHKGERFPTFFRIQNEPQGGLVKECPINGTCKVVFETDAENKYFSRGDDPGIIRFFPARICRRWNLNNGHLTARFSAPLNSRIADAFLVKVDVTDRSRVAPFTCKFRIRVGTERQSPPPRPSNEKGQTGFDMPNVVEVQKNGWGDHDFDEFSALQLRSNGTGGYDLFVNMDNHYLLTEMRRENNPSYQHTLKYWFKYGLVFSSIGMMRERLRAIQDGGGGRQNQNGKDELDSESLKSIEQSCGGIARVVIPVIRGLSKGAKS